jgi:hypothetical protein
MTVDVSEFDTVRIAAFDQPVTCDPHAAYDSTSRHVVLNVYEPLFKIPSSTLEPIPHLAREATCERLPGGEVRHRFTIRDGVRDHEGGLLALDDVHRPGAGKSCGTAVGWWPIPTRTTTPGRRQPTCLPRASISSTRSAP